MKSGTIVPVLMYHHVTPAGGAINVSPDNFRDQLDWLRRHGYKSLDCRQFADHLAGQAAPARSVLITFDDGYLDNYIHAWPLLQEYGFNAAIFLVTAWVGDGPARTLAGLQSQGQTPLPDHAESQRRIQAGDTDSVILRWSEIEQMRKSGVCEFHSHTHTHTRWDLQQVDKNAHMREELTQSRASLTHNLGQVSDHLCWPQGYFDQDYVKIARELGFRHLYTTRAFGRNRPGSDPGSIFRFAVRNTSGASVGRRIQVAGNPLLAPVFNSWKKFRRGHVYSD